MEEKVKVETKEKQPNSLELLRLLFVLLVLITKHHFQTITYTISTLCDAQLYAVLWIIIKAPTLCGGFSFYFPYFSKKSTNAKCSTSDLLTLSTSQNSSKRLPISLSITIVFRVFLPCGNCLIRS